MTGRIEDVVIGWTIDTPDGPRSATIDLATMRQHCRPERVEDLLDDLQLLCEDVQDARNAADRPNSARLQVLK